MMEGEVTVLVMVREWGGECQDEGWSHVVLLKIDPLSRHLGAIS